MTTIVLQVYEAMEKTQGLMHDGKGKILNPTYKIKLKEFEYVHKFAPRFQMMGFTQVDFVEAYDVQEISGQQSKLTPVSPEKLEALKKVLTDKLNNVAPPPPLSPAEKENLELKARLERMEMMIEKIASKTVDQIPVDETPKQTVPPEIDFAEQKVKITKPKS